jgi:ribosome-associated protein
MTSEQMVRLAATALDSKKGHGIKALRTGDLTTLADYFVICTGSSNTQIKALSDAVEKALSEAGEQPHHVEGHRSGTWVLMDYSCVIVHIFTEETRQFYDLERLWRDAEEVDLSGILLPD